MKILYIARAFSDNKTGASQVMSRNLRSLIAIAGKENVIQYYLPSTTAKNVLESLARFGSYGVSKKNEKDIIELVKKYEPEYAFVESSVWGSIYKNLHRLGVHSICFAHNLDVALSKQEMMSRNMLISVPKYISIKINEKKSLKYADTLICLNNRDSNGFKEMYGRQADLVLPITFPEREIEECRDGYETIRCPYYLFVGSDFFPNVEGIKWFIENVAAHLNADVHIVGSCCHNQELRQLELPKNVYLLGYVDNLNKEYNCASGVIAPIFKGSGMKTKTVEALSYGKSVFGTQEAFVGIEGDFTKIGGLCNNAEEFINAINSSDHKPFNIYSYKLFTQEYSDSVFLTKLKSFLFNEQ